MKKVFREGFKPILFDIINKKQYSWSLLQNDLTAGIILSILSLPMVISFAISSGVRPEQGIYTAIIAGFVVAALGGSRFQISGPTGAFVALIYSIIQSYGYEGLAIATILAGLFLIFMGSFKLGRAIYYIPYPVIIGFTSGLACTIFINQIPAILEINIDSSTHNVITKLYLCLKAIPLSNFYSIFIGMLTIAIMITWKKFFSKIPGSLIAIFVTTLIFLIFNLPIETISSKYGTITCSFPKFKIPNFNFSQLIDLISISFSIALLAAVESLLSASVADGMTETKHKPDIELIAQGIGNIFSILFSGIPITAGIARTAAGIKNGAKTPFASIFNSIFLIIFIVFFGKWIVHIPISCLAGVLVIIAYNMSEWRHFAKLFMSPKSDIAVLLTTFILTICFGITIAIQAGIILAVFLFVSKMSEKSYGRFLKEKTEQELKDDPWSIHLRTIPDKVDIFEIQGPFFFAAAEKFKTALFRINWRPEVLIIRLRNVPFLDATALRALEDIYVFTKKQKINLILSGVQNNTLFLLKKSGFADKIGSNNILPNIDEALELAKKIVGTETPKEEQLIIN